MTTVRNLALTLSVGGVVASSLPSSLKKVNKEIDELRAKAAADREELKRLSTELRGLDKDTEAYNETAGKVQGLKDSLAETGEAQRALVIRQRQGQAQVRSMGNAFRNTGIAAGFLTAAIIAGAVAIATYSNRLRSFSALAALTGRTTRDLDKEAQELGDLLGDRNLARSAVVALATLNQEGQSLQANFGQATLAGLDLAKLRLGTLGIEDAQAALRDIRKENDVTVASLKRNALKEVIGEDVLAAAEQLENATDKTLEFRQVQTQATRSVVELKDAVSKGLTPVLTPLFSATARVSSAIAGASSGWHTFIGVVGIGGIVLGVLATAVAGFGFVMLGLKNAYDITKAATIAFDFAQKRSLVITKAGAVLTGIRAAVQGVLSGALFASVGGFVAATVAAIGFNVATGGVLIGIGVLVAGIVLLIRHFDKLSSVVKPLVRDMKSLGRVFSFVGGLIGGASANLQGFESVAFSTGTSVQALEKDVQRLTKLLGDPELAKQAAEGLARLRQEARAGTINRGDVIAAGLDLEAIKAGKVGLDELRKAQQRLAVAQDYRGIAALDRLTQQPGVQTAVVRRQQALDNPPPEAQQGSRLGRLIPASLPPISVLLPGASAAIIGHTVAAEIHDLISGSPRERQGMDTASAPRRPSTEMPEAPHRPMEGARSTETPTPPRRPSTDDIPRAASVSGQPPRAEQRPQVTEMKNYFTITGVENADDAARAVVRRLERRRPRLSPATAGDYP